MDRLKLDCSLTYKLVRKRISWLQLNFNAHKHWIV